MSCHLLSGTLSSDSALNGSLEAPFLDEKQDSVPDHLWLFNIPCCFSEDQWEVSQQNASVANYFSAYLNLLVSLMQNKACVCFNAPYETIINGEVLLHAQKLNYSKSNIEELLLAAQGIPLNQS